MLVGVAAAAAFATGQRVGMIAGALLLQAAFSLDCVDGQLARYTRTFTKFGAWLDSVFDRAKEYVVYGGLAIGASRAGDPVWVLASAALTLQTVRHVIAFSYGAAQHQAIGAAPQRPLEEADDGYVPPTPRGRAGGLVRLSNRLNSVPGVLWVKRIVAFPIGERFAAISLTAAIWDARVTFLALLAWGLFATAYALPGQVLRSRRNLGDRSELELFRDDGPLARALARRIPRARLDWLVPPLLRLVEYSGLLWIAVSAGRSSEPAAFALLAVLAFRHYDLVYRLRHQGVPPAEWLGVLAGGWDGRLILGWVLFAAGALPAGFFVLAGLLGAVLVTESVASWVRFARDAGGAGSFDDDQEDEIQ
jgi:phosphatidylglycerophosphate synthase